MTTRASKLQHTIYAAGECPVCFDSGALLLLKAHGSGTLFFYCPLCGVAWHEPPLAARLESIDSLKDFAPHGAALPTKEEALATGFALKEVPFDRWVSWLESIEVPMDSRDSDEEIGPMLQRVRGLSSAALAKLLCAISWELTVRARDTYVPGTEAVHDPAKLRALNECQHFLLGVLQRLLCDAPVDTDALVRSLEILAQEPAIGPDVRQAMRSAFRQTVSG
jgi:hypothetical protein